MFNRKPERRKTERAFPAQPNRIPLLAVMFCLTAFCMRATIIQNAKVNYGTEKD